MTWSFGGTLFRPGSVSKLFTWTAVMRLIERGKINLDENGNTYLDFQIPDATISPKTGVVDAVAPSPVVTDALSEATACPV